MFLVLSICLVVYLQGISATCQLTYKTYVQDQFLPFILYNNTHVFPPVLPTSDVIEIQEGTKLAFICSNYKDLNSLWRLNARSTYAVCENSRLMVLNRYDFNFQDIRCTKTVQALPTKVTGTCKDNTVFDIGFAVTTEYNATVIQVCYDDARKTPRWTKHILHGGSIKYASTTMKHTGFKTEGLDEAKEISEAFTKSNQAKRLEELLGTGSYINTDPASSYYLARGHLSPQGDFVFRSGQASTYYVINTVPQWQIINNNNWKRIENMARVVSVAPNTDLTIFTGVYDVLALEDTNKNEQKVYLLNDERLPVPKYMWKIIYDPMKKAGIVLVALNNPYAKSSSNLCKIDICNSYGWGNSDWSDYSKGHVHCCAYAEFKENVEVPSLQVDTVLSGPLK